MGPLYMTSTESYITEFGNISGSAYTREGIVIRKDRLKKVAKAMFEMVLFIFCIHKNISEHYTQKMIKFQEQGM